MGIIERARYFLESNETKPLGGSIHTRIFEIGKHNVIIHQKAGRKIITCSCKSHSLFPNEPTICSHKIAAIVRWYLGENFINIINLIITWRDSNEKN